MRNFQYHLFNPYAVNEGVFDKLSGLFNGKPKKPPSTIAERRQRAIKLNYPDEGKESLYGPDGPISPEILKAQEARKADELKTLKQIAGPNATIEPQPKNPIPPRTAESQPSNVQPPKTNNPTNKITSIPIGFVPPTSILPAAVSGPPPPSFKYTSPKLKGIIGQLQQQQKGVKIGEMNQYTPYLFHSPLLEYNDEYLNENLSSWVEKIKRSLKKLAGKEPGADDRMIQTAQNIDQGAGKNNPHARQLRIMQQTGLGSKAANNVLRTQKYQESLPRELTGFGQKVKKVSDVASTAGVSIDQARRMVATMDRIEERKNKNLPNNPRSRIYSNRNPIRRESTDISQYSPYLFHSPLLEDFYFTENCIDDPIEYPPYVGL